MKLSLYFPVKPATVLQKFGENPAYYARFLDPNGNPEKGHNGIDFQTLPHGQPVYAAHDGLATYVKDAHGGEGVWNYGNGFATISFHLIGDTDPAYPPPIPYKDIYVPVKAGQLIGYANNTGAPFESTGPHLHFGLILLDAQKQPLNPGNGFGGCVNPEPYFNGFCAEDISTLIIVYTKLVSTLKSLVGIYTHN